MNTVRVFLLAAFLAGAGISLLAVDAYGKHKCHYTMATMMGVKACMEAPGCFYDADDFIDAKRALDYHKANCKDVPPPKGADKVTTLETSENTEYLRPSLPLSPSRQR